jgi:hypothetical protein
MSMPLLMMMRMRRRRWRLRRRRGEERGDSYVMEWVSDFRKALGQGNGQDIELMVLTQARAATGAFGLTTALAGVVESQARSISN